MGSCFCCQVAQVCWLAPPCASIPFILSDAFFLRPRCKLAGSGPGSHQHGPRNQMSAAFWNHLLHSRHLRSAKLMVDRMSPLKRPSQGALAAGRSFACPQAFLASPHDPVPGCASHLLCPLRYSGERLGSLGANCGS